MATNYGRLYRAVSILIGANSIQQRLANAFRDEIQHISLEELSETARVELETIRDELTKMEPSGDMDAIDMSAAALGNDQAEEMAIEILDLYEEAAKGQR